MNNITVKRLCTSKPLFSKRFPFTQSSCVVPSLICVLPPLEISTPTHPRTSKKHGNRQADGGGHIFHSENLGRTRYNGVWMAVGYLTPNLFRYRSTAELGISLLSQIGDFPPGLEWALRPPQRLPLLTIL